MKVILQKDVTKVGREGEIVLVSDGFARNYLLPRALAVEAAGGALKSLQMRNALEERKAEKLLAHAQAAHTALDGKTVTITAKAGTGERLYGSITSADVAAAVKASTGITVDKRKVQLMDPIKALGTFTVPIKLHREIAVTVTVQVAKA